MRAILINRVENEYWSNLPVLSSLLSEWGFLSGFTEHINPFERKKADYGQTTMSFFSISHLQHAIFRL